MSRSFKSLNDILSPGKKYRLTGENTLPCPHCNHPAAMQSMKSVEWSEGDPGNTTTHSAHLMQCRTCNRAVTVHSPLGSGAVLSDQSMAECVFYPGIMPAVVDPELPEKVQAILSEAASCYSVCAWNAVGTMCRRAVQEAVILKGAQGPTLFKQLEDLKAKGVIVDLLCEAAHKTRIFGRDGAHADTFINLTRKDASDAINYCNQLFNYLFVLPAKLKTD